MEVINFYWIKHNKIMKIIVKSLSKQKKKFKSYKLNNNKQKDSLY